MLGTRQVRGCPGWFLPKGNGYFVGKLQDTLPMPVRAVFAVVFLPVLDNSVHAVVDFDLYLDKYFQTLWLKLPYTRCRAEYYSSIVVFSKTWGIALCLQTLKPRPLSFPSPQLGIFARVSTVVIEAVPSETIEIYCMPWKEEGRE